MVSQYGAVVLVPGWTGWLTEISADLREAIVHHRRVLDDALTNPPQLLFYFRKNGRDLLAVLRLIIIIIIITDLYSTFRYRDYLNADKSHKLTLTKAVNLAQNQPLWTGGCRLQMMLCTAVLQATNDYEHFTVINGFLLDNAHCFYAHWLPV